MPFCTSQILDLATSIQNDLNNPSDLSTGYVSGWIVSSGTLGEVNSRLNTCYYISGDTCIANGFGGAEASIMELMFLTNYYRRQQMATLQFGGVGSFVTNLREGDSSVTFEARTKVATQWGNLKKDAESDLYVAIANWKLDHSVPVAVLSEPLASWPTP